MSQHKIEELFQMIRDVNTLGRVFSWENVLSCLIPAETEYGTLISDKKSMELEVKKLSNQYNDSKKTIQLKESEYRNLQLRFDELSMNKEKLCEYISEILSLNSRLATENNQLRENETQLTKTISNLESQIIEIKTKESNFVQVSDALQNHILSLESQCNSSKKEIENSDRTISNLESVITKYQNEVDVLKKQHHEIEQLLNNKDKEINELQLHSQEREIEIWKFATTFYDVFRVLSGRKASSEDNNMSESRT